MLEEFEQAWNTRHQGTQNAHKIAIVTGGEVDFTALTMPLDDAQFLEQRKLSAVEVARVFRVPPWMIGADSGESMTYSNVEQEALHFVTYSLRPWLVCIEQAITADPDLCSARVYVEFLLDALLRADSATRAEVYTKALDPITGWMNRDEVRRLENLDPEPEPVSPAVEQVIAPAPAEARTREGDVVEAIRALASQPPPVVNVDVRGERVRKRIVRDDQGRAAEIVEESMNGNGATHDCWGPCDPRPPRSV